MAFGRPCGHSAPVRGRGPGAVCVFRGLVPAAATQVLSRSRSASYSSAFLSLQFLPRGAPPGWGLCLRVVLRGRPLRWGGASPSFLDCSGYVTVIFLPYGIAFAQREANAPVAPARRPANV
ncbi:MAG: C40 family peptidase [Calditrichaeota bacterium]|nr:C40 family peptidase [Calditrichota bacterium]